MAGITITRPHALAMDDARAAAETVAEKLASRFDVNYSWDGDSIRFKGSGAKGLFIVDESAYRVEMEIGLMLRPFKSKIENEIVRLMDQHAG